MWDGGSTLSLITFKKAKSLNLQGESVKLGMEVAGGGISLLDSRLYKVKLLKEDGDMEEIEIFGLEKISSQIDKVGIQKVAKLLKVDEKDFSRPEEGEIDILIGQQYAAFHPCRQKAVGHLLLLQNEFGGHVISGSHPEIKTVTEITKSCLQARSAKVMHATGGLEQFFEIEGLGVRCQPRCGSCKCGTCQPGGKNMSLKEEAELEMIDTGLQFDEQKRRWRASYPWVKSPADLPDNRAVAMATLRSIEKRLLDKKQEQMYSAQVEDMVRRGAARVVSDQELAEYSGPKFYLSHFGVSNPNSKSTPLRIVYNSSARFHGHSLNDYLAKGPSMLNLLPGVLLRFRENNVGLVGDISKMFHAIEIPVEDQMTHLFLWRDCDTKSPPRTYAMTAVNMGDKPSATIAQVALRKTAQKSLGEFPEAAGIITDNSYMDDIVASVSNEQEAKKTTQQIDRILNENGFKIKEWFVSGDEKLPNNVNLRIGEDSKLEQTEGVLGLDWFPRTDLLRIRTGVIPDVIPDSVTKRSILSSVSQIYDPLGLLTPFTVKLKILLRRIWALEPKLGWDAQLPAEIIYDWIVMNKEIGELSDVYFRRSFRPERSSGSPVLIVFSDGSINAYGAVAYLRWEVDGEYVSRLVAAKSRIAPLKTLDIVRIELCGAVLAKRLREMLEKELKTKVEKVIHITDSEIVQAMVWKESYGFNTFTANRIGEIHQTTKSNEWYWIAGKAWLNVADLTTRGCSPSEIGIDSIWQNGPEFLKEDEQNWPTVSAPKQGLSLPGMKEKFVGKVSVKSPESICDHINIERFSKWRMLLRVTARIIRLKARCKRRIDGSMEPEKGDMEEAEREWFKHAQSSLDLKSLKKLNPREEDGVIIVGGRTERWMEATWNQQKFVLLPKDHRLTELVIWDVHVKGGHLGIEASVAKVRARYWVIGLRKTMKRLIQKCVKCRKKLEARCKQTMSGLPIERLKPCPAFSHVVIDYFGPFTIRGEVQKRVHGKCYGLIFTCMGVRAVYVDLAVDYSTDGFLQVLRRFVSLRGSPAKVFSDPGTQLVGASNELGQVVDGLDWNKIRDDSSEKLDGMEWHFSPGNAPWYNGAVESLVKTVKRALTSAIGDQILTFSELQTCMFEASQLVNQRPIGRTPSSPEDGTYLSPNDMLLGRTSPKTPQLNFEMKASQSTRIGFIQSIVNAFWKRWKREIFPQLVLQQKWHTEARNLVVGDVVLVEDSDALRGEWKMARVIEAKAGEDGKVRRVRLFYKSKAGTAQEIERAVQKLILLVPADGDASSGEG